MLIRLIRWLGFAIAYLRVLETAQVDHYTGDLDKSTGEILLTARLHEAQQFRRAFHQQESQRTLTAQTNVP